MVVVLKTDNASNNPELAALLRSYPRVRPAMSDAVQGIYLQEYQDNRSGRHIAQKASQFLERWLHHQVVANAIPGSVLEIGGCTLNHLKFESKFDRYDVIEPLAELYESSTQRSRVREFFADIAQVPLDRQYNRIVSVATLEHLTNLPVCLARSGLLLAPDGIFQAAIPSEGAFLWNLAWRLSTGLSFRLRTGLDYGELMRHEHVNTAEEILELVRYFYERVSIVRFPTPVHHLSVYAYIECRNPDTERCKRYVANQ